MYFSIFTKRLSQLETELLLIKKLFIFSLSIIINNFHSLKNKFESNFLFLQQRIYKYGFTKNKAQKLCGKAKQNFNPVMFISKWRYHSERLATLEEIYNNPFRYSWNYGNLVKIKGENLDRSSFCPWKEVNVLLSI